MLAQAVEWLLGKTTITPETYASRIVPLLFAPELSGKSGLLFNQAGDAILPTPAMESKEHVDAFIAESRELISRGLAADLSSSKSS